MKYGHITPNGNEDTAIQSQSKISTSHMQDISNETLIYMTNFRLALVCEKNLDQKVIIEKMLEKNDTPKCC